MSIKQETKFSTKLSIRFSRPLANLFFSPPDWSLLAYLKDDGFVLALDFEADFGLCFLFAFVFVNRLVLRFVFAYRKNKKNIDNYMAIRRRSVIFGS